ncbi:MAG TPA: hypothetical protein VGQ37_01720 [Vicinamibacterales bacterium]|jgi:hypothetical protein|nr:hypothetical protein [Vicinamibacterales bacterium]
MAVRIVLDCPHPYLGPRLREALLAAIGACFAVVGTVAWLLIVPMSVLAIAWLRGENINLDLENGRVITDRMLLTTWGAVAACIVLRFRGRGLRLVRGARTSVLFLRRFGYTDATRAVTFAVTNTIGRTWRLVTLDDNQTAPLGIPSGPKWFFTISHGVMRAVLAPFKILRFYPLALALAIVIIAADVGRAVLWPTRGTSVETVVTRYFELFDVMFLSRRLPLDAVQLNGPGVFAVILITMGWPFVVLPPIALAVPPWVWLVALAFFVYVAFSIDVVRNADKGRTRHVTAEPGIFSAVREVGEASQRLLAPRLFVLRVEPAIWQQTVSSFARHTSVALVDISEPSVNLLWEIEELTLRTRTPCVFIGEYDRVAPLGDDRVRSQSEQGFPQLAILLGEEEVLAYSTDRAGRQRFARALRGKLQAATTPVRAA